MSQFLATIDYQDGTLVLRPRSDSPAFEAQAARRGAVRVPLWLVGDHFLFARGRLGGAPEGLFLIDTGCSGCGVLASEAALKLAHISPDASQAGTGIGGGGAVTVLPFKADVTLGSVTEHAVRGFYVPHPSMFPFEVQGSISHGFFRYSALTLDFDAMVLVMQNEGAGAPMVRRRADPLIHPVRAENVSISDWVCRNCAVVRLGSGLASAASG